ncbi:hypothetical protein FQN55_004641 [Onygenales sp. PD_40]|nr:hypothetical protein FQN55_004641 [Onygenales sp. PD_40]KAK2803320.1 hypothetical protein FQN51_003741 [Onygenales sp. PD_10]
MVSAREILDIVIVAYYIPALGTSLFVALKHGFSKEIGFIYLAILSLVREIGAICGIVNFHQPSTGLAKTSIITSSVGLSPLILAMAAMLQRVNKGMSSGKGISDRIFQALHLPQLVALILGIIGGMKQFDEDPEVQKTGHNLSRASIIIFFVILVVQSLIAAVTLLRLRYVRPEERKMVYIVGASIPFLFVRILYALISSFSNDHDTFNQISPSNKAVLVQACMAILEEFVVVALYLLAGIATPGREIERKHSPLLNHDDHVEIGHVQGNKGTSYSAGYRHPSHQPYEPYRNN